MRNFGVRYASLLGVMMSMFVTFVACGTQLYRVSLVNDNSGNNNSSMMSSADSGSKDPDSPVFGLHAPGGWVNMPIHFRVDYRLAQDQVQGLLRAMATWEMAVGHSLFKNDGVHQGVTGDSFKDLYSSLTDGINGHYLDDNWGKTGKPTEVLATTIWDNDESDSTKITTSDMRFNNQNYVFGDSFLLKKTSDREVVDIQTLATHELGHMLGLAHIDPAIDPNSIMVPSLYIGEGLSNRHISRGDIARIQHIYACQNSACDIDATFAAIDQTVRESNIPTNVEATH